MRRKLLVGFLVLGVAYAAASAALYAVMLQPPARIGAMKARVPWMAVAFLPFEPLWTHARAGALSVGRPAEDFTLPTLDRKTSVRLSDAWREKPVVLIFGSYTWPPFRREVPALNQLYRQYRDKAQFYIIYIEEAHPTDLWQMKANVRDGVLFASPRSDEERSGTANTCVRKLGIEIPALVDGVENRVERAYTAWPDRIYLIAKGGNIIFKSAAGPFGFSAPELAKALEAATG